MYSAVSRISSDAEMFSASRKSITTWSTRKISRPTMIITPTASMMSLCLVSPAVIRSDVFMGHLR